MDHLTRNPDRNEYAADNFCMMVDMEGETEELNFHNVAYINELDEDMFDNMLELWAQGEMIERGGHVVGEFENEDDA